MHCVTLRYRQGGPGHGQGVTALPTVTCYTVFHCVTLRYKREGPGQGFTVSPPVTGYTVLQARRTRTERYSITASHWLHCYTSLQAGRTMTERYSITASRFLHCVTLHYRRGGPGQGVTVLPGVTSYTVLHCVTGGEDQDRALQYYRLSLVTLCYTSLQAGRTRTWRYGITCSNWLHCYTSLQAGRTRTGRYSTTGSH